MNHLCNSHCEFCSTNIVEEYENGQEEAIFSFVLIGTNGEQPYVLDYSFQTNFSLSLCIDCGTDLLCVDQTAYNWEICHCCGKNVNTEDISAFRLSELVIDGIEEHPIKNDIFNFVSGSNDKARGPVGYTVCMDCVVGQLQDKTGHEMMKEMIREAIDEGDVYEEVEEWI